MSFLKSKQTSKSEPWSAAQPGLRDILQRSRVALRQDQFAPNPVPFADETRQSFGALQDIAGSGFSDQAMGTVQGFLDGSGQEGIRDSIMAEVMPQVAGMFGRGGFANSTTAQGVAAKEAARALAPYESNSRFQALGMAPSIQGMGFKDAQALRTIGQQKEARRQQMRGQTGANLRGAADLFGSIGGLGRTQTGSTSPSALEVISGIGESAANGATAFAMLCDRRLKRDIEEVGTWRGVKLYLFRYFWDDVLRIGPMAQEVPERARVTLPGGVLAVEMGAI